MAPVLTCPDCGAQVASPSDLQRGRRVHELLVDDSVSVNRDVTVDLWHCADCELVLGIS
jgi:hypothetical protein